MSNQTIVQQMLDTIYPILNQSGQPYYLPTFVQDNKYDPYGPFDWNIGNLTTPTLLQNAASICPAIQIDAEGKGGNPCSNPSQQYILTPAIPNPPQYYPQLTLSGCSIVGLSNVTAQRPIAGGPDGMTVTAPVVFSQIAGMAPQVTISGNFSLTAYCCCSNDGTTCAGSPQPQVGSGTFNAVIQSSSGTGVFVISALAPQTLTITAQSITLNVPTDSTGKPMVTVTIKITSITGKAQQSYNNLAQEAFNSKEGLDAILAQINATLNSPSALGTFASIMTKEVDGYLQSHHLYPFDGALLTVF